MTDRRFEIQRSELRSEAAASPIRRVRDSGEVILLTLVSVLGLLWAIVLVTHFHGPLSSFGQSLWLTR
jgi:hypothetical protein